MPKKGAQRSLLVAFNEAYEEECLTALTEKLAHSNLECKVNEKQPNLACICQNLINHFSLLHVQKL